MTEKHTGFEAIGTQITLGTGSTVYKRVSISAGAVRVPGSNPASWADLGITGVWQFADGLTKVVVLQLPMPKDIDATQDAVIELHWSTPASSKVCRWYVEYLFLAMDQDSSAAAEATLTQDEDSSAQTDGLNMSNFTVVNANIAATDHCLFVRISRIGGNAADTLADVADLHHVALKYVANKLGETV